MKSKRKSIDQQLQLIMECRKSGLSDYQWCKRHDINPSTFYNWINRLHGQGTELPESTSNEEIPPSKQEVVKVELIHEDTSLSTTMNQNTNNSKNLANISVHPAVEIILGNATIRFFNGTEKQLIETTFQCLGGVIHVG